NLLLVALVGFCIGDAIAHATRHDQNGRGAVTFGIAHGLLDAFDGFGAVGGVRVGQRTRNFARGDAWDDQTGFVSRAQDFILVEVAWRFNAVVSGGFDHPELFKERDTLSWERAQHVAFFELSFHDAKIPLYPSESFLRFSGLSA